MKKVIAGAGLVAALFVGEAFVGDINWRNVLELNESDAIRVAARSIGVGYRNTPDGFVSRCNYWSVGNSMVLANGHCIDAKTKDTTGITVHFTERVAPVICDKMLAFSPWEAYDYLLLKCRSDVPRALPLDPRGIGIGEKLVHISHNCDYYADSQCKIIAKYDNGPDCVVTDNNLRGGLDIAQGCDSLGGSSGSPVFSRELKDGKLQVIALHHSGAFYQDSRGTDEGRGYYNGSVYISHVLQDLKAKGFDLLKVEPVETAPIEDKPTVDSNGWIKFLSALFDFFKMYFK